MTIWEARYIIRYVFARLDTGKKVSKEMKEQARKATEFLTQKGLPL